MTPAEAAAIAERHVVHPRAHGDRDVFTHGFDFCNEDKQRWPCDAHRLATAYLKSVAVTTDALAAALQRMTEISPGVLAAADMENNHDAVRGVALYLMELLADVAGEVTP